jgi:predicted HAD superfamily Cof-like phosphohydrolase
MRHHFKSEHQKRVEKMMVMARQDLYDKPTLPSVKTRRLRASLILEEALETIQALGFEIFFDDSHSTPIDHKRVLLKEIQHTHEDEMHTHERIVDGCADIIVVTTGCLSACGVSDVPILEEVDRNNLEKFGAGGYKREDGKWIKPPDHNPPNIRQILERLQKQ